MDLIGKFSKFWGQSIKLKRGKVQRNLRIWGSF